MITNITKDRALSAREDIADNFFTRAIGLIGRKDFSSGEAMVIKPCNSVHTFFMRFPVDVLFLDRNHKVVNLIESMKPFRASRINFRADYAVELPAGTIRATYTAIGDTLSLTPAPTQDRF